MPHGSRASTPPSGKRSTRPPARSTLAAAADDARGVGQHEIPVDQARLVFTRGRRARGPRVRAEMMMVAAGGHEQRARVAPDHLVETERVMVEGGARVEVTDVQMDVAHAVPLGMPDQRVLPAAATRFGTSRGSVDITSSRPS